MGTAQSSACECRALRRKRLRQVHTSELHPGDLLLIRQPSNGLGVPLDTSVLRAVATATTKNYYTAQRVNVSGWTHVAVVVPHDGVLYAVQPSFAGIHVCTVARRVRALVKQNAKFAARRLRVPFTPDMNETLDAFSTMVARGFKWAAAGNDPVSPGAAAAAAAAVSVAPSGAGGHPAVDTLRRQFVAAVVPRLYASLSQTPPQLEMEVFRAFRSVDTAAAGHIERRDVPRVLKAVNGTAVDFEKTLRVLDLLPFAAGTGVRVDDLLLALRQQPKGDLPIEHDAEAMLCGEFVAFFYERMGLLPRRDRPPLPHAKSEVGVSMVPAAAARTTSFRMTRQESGLPATVASDTVPAIDHGVDNLSFFTASSFSSHHDPKVMLVRGELDVEAVLTTGDDTRPTPGHTALAQAVLPWRCCAGSSSRGGPRVNKARVVGF